MIPIPFTILSAIETLSYYEQQLSNAYNLLETPLKYLTKISPTINTLNYIARTPEPWFLDYLPEVSRLNTTYQKIQRPVAQLSKYHSTITETIRDKRTSALLAALGTTSSLISCGAPAILIMGSSILAATAAWQKQKRSEELTNKEQNLDKQISFLTQEYSYTCEDTKLSITTEASKTSLDKIALEPLDYAKLALDMSIAFCSNSIGQINVLLSPSMLLYEKRRLAQIKDKEEKLEQMLSKLKPEDRKKVQETMEKISQTQKSYFTRSLKNKPRKITNSPAPR